MRADYPPDPPRATPPERDVRPQRGEVVYVPGPVRPQPAPSAWTAARTRLKQQDALAVPRNAMDDVALAKQALLDFASAAPQPGRRRSLPRIKPIQAAIAGLLVIVVTYVPMTRTAFKVGLIFALRSAITRLISRYV